MTDTDHPRTEAVRRALEALPMSRREIARRAGLAHTTLNRIANRTGGASPDVAEAVATALDELAGEVMDARDVIRDAMDHES